MIILSLILVLLCKNIASQLKADLVNILLLINVGIIGIHLTQSKFYITPINKGFNLIKFY